MTLKIFLDDKSFHCLKQAIPRLKQAIPHGSRSKLVLEEAVPLKLFGNEVVISCDQAQARNLLLYADHCPGVIASIHKAFRSAGLRQKDEI
jgi:hypothetical protein